MPHRNQDALPFLPPSGTTAKKLALLFVIFAPCFIGLLALALGQDSNWDLRNYHWYNAYAFLHNRLTYDILPSQLPFFYTPLLDLPFYVLGTHFSAKITAFFLGTLQGLNLSLIFILAHATLIIPNQKKKVMICAGLAVLGMMGGGGIAMIGTTFYDNVTSLGLFASAALVMRLFPMLISSSKRIALTLVFLCGIPAGLLMGMKLPFVIFCFGLSAAFLFVTGSRTRRIMLAFGFGLGAAFGFVLCFAPWAYYLAAEYGSPLFPYFNDIFGSDLAPLHSGRDMKFIPSTFWDRALYPYIFALNPLRVGEIPWQDFRIPIFYTLLPIAVGMRLLYGRNKNEPNRVASFYAKRYLLWVALFSYFVWLILFGIYRYLVPLEMLAPLLIVLLMGLLPIRSEPRNLLTIFILFIIAITVQPGDWGRKNNGWLDKPIQVTLPPLGDTDNLMILMAGYAPYAHVLPSFPKDIPFIRIQSNFTSPEKNIGFNKRIKTRIFEHKGDYKLLIPAWDINSAKKALFHFNLSILSQTCTDIKDHLYDSQLKLCDLQMTEPKS